MPWRTCGFDSRWALSIGNQRCVGKSAQSAWFGPRRSPVRIRPHRLTCLSLYRGCMSWFVRLSVKEEFAGSIPAPGALDLGKGKPTGDGTRLENGRAMSLEGSTPSPSAGNATCSWPIGEAPVLQTGQAGSTPAEHFGDRLTGRRPGLDPGDGGSNPPPRT